jgi:hypothetical protein
MSADPAGVALREFSIISSCVKKSTIDFDINPMSHEKEPRQ